MAVELAMKKVLIRGPGSDFLRPLVEEAGLVLVESAPDVVITWGGDGQLLGAERDFPGVPKLPLRNSRYGKKCDPGEVPEVLAALIAGKLLVTRHTKVQAEVGSERRVGLNDIIVHNSRPTSSVRYRVWIDGREFADEIVGDGVVVASTFGSTAYYRSITGSIFRVGLGVAFNNSTEPVDHLVLAEEAEIRVVITRGPALVAADNDPSQIPLDEEDEVLIRRADERAVVLSLPRPR